MGQAMIIGPHRIIKPVLWNGDRYVCPHKRDEFFEAGGASFYRVCSKQQCRDRRDLIESVVHAQRSKPLDLDKLRGHEHVLEALR